MDELDSDSSLSGSQSLSDEDVVRQAADALLRSQDNIINLLSIPIAKGGSGDDIESADTEVLNRVALNLSLINGIRFRNCRLLVSAGLPAFAIREFASLTTLTFDELDTFYRALAMSIGARSCHNWYVNSADTISRLFSEYGEELLAKNFKLFAATCIECALLDKDYELVEVIADNSDDSPPFEHRLLEWICIAYWLIPERSADAGKWSEIAIANNCPSQYPYIIKCRSLLEMGDLSEAVACLDQAERFFYSIGFKDAYAAILQERSTLMSTAFPEEDL